MRAPANPPVAAAPRAPIAAPPVAMQDPAAAPPAAVLDELRALLPMLRTLVMAAGSAPAEPAEPAGVAPNPVPAELVPPSAWESAEFVARLLEDTEAEDDHARHAPPHPAAAQSATPGHPLHDLRRTIAGLASARGIT